MLSALWGLEYFRYYVYGKKVNLLTDHQALQPSLKRNRAHKQYSAILTRWLDRLRLFDVNVQYTTGKNIPLTDYLGCHPIAHDSGTETSYAHDEKEAEDEFVINQIYGVFAFDRTNGSITQRINRPPSVPKSDQSRQSIQMCEKTKNEHSIQTLLPRNNNKPETLKTSKSIHRQNQKWTRDRSRCYFQKEMTFPRNKPTSL